MKTLAGILVVLGLTSASLAYAEKPAWAGKDKTAKEQMKSQYENTRPDTDEEAQEAHERAEKEHKKAEEKMKKARTENEEKYKKEKKDMDDDHEQERVMDKQRESKTMDMRKETGKGSEQGQASREEHSRKWWKFWGE